VPSRSFGGEVSLFGDSKILFLYVALGLFACSAGYLLLAIVLTDRFGREIVNPPLASGQRPVTLIKPICGLEWGLADNLRTFCNQDYGTFQVIFGVHSPRDLAIPVIRKVIAEFPERDLSLVVCDRLIGSNYKISNIANMAEYAKHDILVISDSDMRVDPSYLKAVIEPFGRADVGATTCLYSGHGRGGIVSRVAAMFINDWFLPSALIPRQFAEQDYCFGATMAVRRDVLDQSGGIQSLADFLADDYMLGQRVIAAGYKIALVPYVVANIIHEKSLSALYHHELRWAHTIKSVQPIGYLLSAITDIFSISLLAGAALLAAGYSPISAAMPVVLAMVLRTVLHGKVSGSLLKGDSYSPWLVPLRDGLSFIVRATSYFSGRVQWRGTDFTLMENNRIRVGGSPPNTRSRDTSTEIETHDDRREKDLILKPADV